MVHANGLQFKDKTFSHCGDLFCLKRQCSLIISIILTDKHSENNLSFFMWGLHVCFSASCLTSLDTFPHSRGEVPCFIALSKDKTPFSEDIFLRKLYLKIKSSACTYSIPVFPIISSQDLSARIFICKGVIKGINDQSLTVESREQEAIVKGRLGWQVKPDGRKNKPALTKVNLEQCFKNICTLSLNHNRTEVMNKCGQFKGSPSEPAFYLCLMNKGR